MFPRKFRLLSRVLPGLRCVCGRCIGGIGYFLVYANRVSRLRLSLLADDFRTVLAVRGLLRRALRFCRSLSLVISEKQRSAKKPAKQGSAEDVPEPIKIGASTPYDFDSKNLTAYGGLLPAATMLEKLKSRQLVEQTLTDFRANH